MPEDPSSTADEAVSVDEAVSADEASVAEVPDHAHTVLVPISRPDTAAQLLAVARSIVRADGGRVLALTVAVGDADAERSLQVMEELEAEVKAFDENFELLRRSASTIARGILDASRETGADMIVLGLDPPKAGRVEMGRIIDSVVSAAACDVLLYRPARAVTKLADLDRIVVGVHNSPVSRAAVRVGILLAAGFERPVHAVTVHARGRPRAEGWGVLDHALADVEDQEVCRRKVVRGNSVADALLSATDEDDLLIVGFEERSGMRDWVEGDVARKVLVEAAGPTIAVSRIQPAAAPLAKGIHRVVDWLRPQLTDVERETTVWRSEALATTSLDYMTLIVVAAALASLGLLLNSPAVIIGAMLVAPLMGPLVGFGIALRVARLDVVRQAVLTVQVGSFSAFGVSVLIGALVPLTQPTSEMLARGSPTILDAGVAIASGVVGAYATARKDIPAALAGVAIAAALVPPVCVSGLALGMGELSLAGGAALLFLVNITCIAVIGTGVFGWLGLRPSGEADPRQRHISVLAGLLLPVLIGVLFAVSSTRFSVSADQITNALDATVPTAEFSAVEIVDAGLPRLRVEIRGTNRPTQQEVDRLQGQLRTDLGEPALLVDLVFLEVLQAS